MRWWPSRGVGRTAAAPSCPAAEPAHDDRGGAGDYQRLYVYLRDRYADRVVLNFADIEALLGFALPAPARAQREWWDVTGPPGQGAAPSDAWTLASRTAAVNMAAGTVVFDRQVLPRPRHGA
jgi:hypothetical protein